MSKMYPNGGYRTPMAKELSMPLQAAPPTVTSRPTVSGNSVEFLPPIKGGDLRGKMTPGLDGRTSSGKSVEVDLRQFQDYHARNLSWSQREKMRTGTYGSGKQRLTLDLSGREYRVNGRGAIMRAALKLARNLIRGGKRLPKNLWKDLVLTIVDQILQALELSPEFADWSTATVVTNTANSGLWSYDPSLAVRLGDGVAIPGSVKQGDIDPYEPALGEYVVTSVSWLPTNSTANQNTWLNSGKQPFISVRDEITDRMRPWPDSSTFNGSRNITVGSDRPGLFNSRHVATFKIQGRGLLLRSGALSFVAPRIRVGDNYKQGGNSDGTKTKVDERWQMPDKKFGMAPWLQRLAAGAFGATELGDLIDSFYDALPANRKYGRSYLDKLSRLHQYWDEIDWGKAISNVIWNHYEDKFVGKVMGTAGDQLRKTDIGGTNYKYGVTSGGGSTVYTGDIAF